MTIRAVPKSSAGWRGSNVLALALALLAACDPGFTVQGDVLDGAGHPVAGVPFAFTCDGADQNLTDTGSDGRFTIGRIGVFDDHCAVEMRPAGRAPALFPVMGELHEDLRALVPPRHVQRSHRAREAMTQDRADVVARPSASHRGER